jgi:porin
MPKARLRSLGRVAVLATFAAAPAAAQTIVEQSGRIPGLPEPSIASSLPPGLADPGGVRSALARRGILFGVNYIGEVLYNPTGGYDQGGVYDGRLEIEIQADLGKTLGLPGLTFFTNGYQIHGQSLTADNLGVLMPASFIEADPATRLSEIWLEQSLFQGTVSVRFGQLAADTEFILSEGGAALLNGTWGWASLTATNMPQNGPAYPLSTPGVRIAYQPNDAFLARLGVFNGNPAGDCPADADPQECNPHGLEFPLDAPPLLLAEAAYSYNQQPGQLAGTVKLGGYRNFGRYQFQHVITGGVQLDFVSARNLDTDGDFGLYAVIDQMIYRLPGAGDPRGVAVFGRVIGAPDHNPSNIYWEAGVTFSGLHAERPNDTLAVGFADTGISPDISRAQRRDGRPVIASHEALLELSYSAQIVPGFVIQPDFQYFWNPGGHAPDPNDRNVAIPDAAVFGLRTTVNY